MHEKVVTFGKGGALVGILTEPDSARAIPGAPALLFWNVGIHHRVGPHRVFVDLARTLAEAGYTSLRFDVSGMGDSETSRDDQRSEHDRACADVRTAMHMLETRRGIQRFVPVGFCSSVDAAHVLATTEAQIAGIVYLEGYGFVTRGFYARYPLRVFDFNRWERLLRLRFPKLFGEPAGLVDRALDRERIYQREYPTPEKFRDDVQRIVDRGVRALFVYVGGDTRYCYRNQLLEMLGSRQLLARLDLEFFPEADHTFFLLEDRRRMMDAVVRWMQRRFPPSGSGRAAHSSADELKPARGELDAPASVAPGGEP